MVQHLQESRDRLVTAFLFLTLPRSSRGGLDFPASQGEGITGTLACCNNVHSSKGRTLPLEQAIDDALEGCLTHMRIARLLAAARTVRADIDVPLPPVDRADDEHRRDALCTALGDEAFAAAWAAGRTLSLDEAVAFALDESREG
jgi:hypothetical protein